MCNHHKSSFVCFSVGLKWVRLLGGFCNWRFIKNVGGGWFWAKLSWSAFMWSNNIPRCVLSWMTSSLYLRFALVAFVMYSSVPSETAFPLLPPSARILIPSSQTTTSYAAPILPHALLTGCLSQLLLHLTYVLMLWVHGKTRKWKWL